ncbi:MAG: NBR1-Ig-like domain-containing protein, partial [Acidithiobacillus sp.]|nr:NBR1-Ig-like domain-containing protein [Acidithiobacillus sp.]
MIKKYSLGLMFAFLLAAQLACNLSSNVGTPDTIATLNNLYTAAAQTGTAAATQGGASATPNLPLPTTSPALPASTLTPYFLPTTGPVSLCDAATFIKDVTISDGTILTSGVTFTKTWRLENVGACTWTPSYALVFVGGDSMGGPAVIPVPGNINPGETVDLSITLTTPGQNGHYVSYWKLRNANNILFGIGKQAN